MKHIRERRKQNKRELARRTAERTFEGGNVPVYFRALDEFFGGY